MFHFDCFLTITLIVTINSVLGDQFVGNLSLTRDDFHSICEQVGSLVASGVKADQVASIVTNQVITKLESIDDDNDSNVDDDDDDDNDDQSDERSKDKPEKPKSEAMSVSSEGFLNYIVQIILQVFTVENMVVNVAYADNLNMLILGKRSTINFDNNQHHNLNHQRRSSSNGSEICNQIDFPSQLHLDNQSETIKVLSKLSTDADNLIRQLFQKTLRKLSPSSES